MCLDPLVFCMRMIYWDSVPNHNRQIIASNASVHALCDGETTKCEAGTQEIHRIGW